MQTADSSWLPTFARKTAQSIGYAAPGADPKPGEFAISLEAEQVTNEIASAFRYLRGGKIQDVLDFAEFLGGKKIFAPPAAESSFAKLQQVRDFTLFLKQNYGSPLPIDESGRWTDEDEREITAAALQTWDQRETEGQP